MVPLRHPDQLFLPHLSTFSACSFASAIVKLPNCFIMLFVGNHRSVILPLHATYNFASACLCMPHASCLCMQHTILHAPVCMLCIAAAILRHRFRYLSYHALQAIAEQYFPRLEQPSGLPVKAVDTFGREYTFKFRF